MGERGFLRFGEIFENRTGRANRGSVAIGVEAEPFEASRAEMPRERLGGRIQRERPSGTPRNDRPPIGSRRNRRWRFFDHKALGRIDPRQLIGELLRRERRRVKSTRRKLDPR